MSKITTFNKVREMFDISVGEDAIVRQILRAVAAFGRVPKELYHARVTETEEVEYRLARQIRKTWPSTTSPGDVLGV